MLFFSVRLESLTPVMANGWVASCVGPPMTTGAGDPVGLDGRGLGDLRRLAHPIRANDPRR